MSRGITLTRSTQTVYNSNLGNGYRFTVVASNGENIDNNVFRFVQETFNYLTGGTTNTFDGVTSSEQLVSLPIGAPNTNDPTYYFRLDTIDVVVPTRDLSDQMWSGIQDDVSTLITAMNQQDVLSSQDVIRIGDT